MSYQKAIDIYESAKGVEHDLAVAMAVVFNPIDSKYDAMPWDKPNCLNQGELAHKCLVAPLKTKRKNRKPFAKTKGEKREYLMDRFGSIAQTYLSNRKDNNGEITYSSQLILDNFDLVYKTVLDTKNSMSKARIKVGVPSIDDALVTSKERYYDGIKERSKLSKDKIETTKKKGLARLIKKLMPEK